MTTYREGLMTAETWLVDGGFTGRTSVRMTASAATDTDLNVTVLGCRHCWVQEQCSGVMMCVTRA